MDEHLQWDLTEFYPGPDSPELTADMEKAVELAEMLDEFRGRINSPDVTVDTVAQMLAIQEQIAALEWEFDPYAGLLHALNTQNPAAVAVMDRVKKLDVEIQQHTLPVDLEWQKLPADVADPLIDDPRLEYWRHYLERQRALSPYMLSELEEQLLNRFRPVISAWGEHFEHIDSRITIGGQPLTAALNNLYSPDRETRNKTAAAITEALKHEAPYMVDILNAVTDYLLIETKQRGFEGPMAPRNLDNEVSTRTVEALLAACAENTDVAAQYYELKGRLLGLEEIFYYDRFAPLPTGDKRYTLTEARDLYIAAYSRFSPEAGEWVKRAFAKGWLDTAPAVGKRGGAFCATVPPLHPFVLMSWTGTSRDLKTGAHELGHGVHAAKAAAAGISLLQIHPPTLLCEVASIFGEQLLIEELKERGAAPQELLALLCSSLENQFGAIFRQVAMTEFERRIYELRAQKPLSLEQLGKLWTQVQTAALGGSVTFTPDHDWWWAYIGHIFTVPFYCYSYAGANLIVLSLWEKYQQGEVSAEAIMNMLAAGGSESPANLLAKLGIDIEDPAFWQKGLDILRQMVAEAEALAAELGY